MGALVSKYYTSKGPAYKIFEKIYNSTVVPGMDYSAGVWGYKTFDHLIHMRDFIKTFYMFLGVGKQTPLAASDGDELGIAQNFDGTLT